MDIYILMPLICCVAYGVLAVIVLRHPTRARVVFALYLIAGIGWSLASAMAHTALAPQTTYLWAKLLIIIGWPMMVFYYHFVRLFTNKRPGLGVYLGYGTWLVIAVLTALGYILRDAYFAQETLYLDYGNSFYLVAGSSAIFMIAAVVNLVRHYRGLTDPVARRRVVYLLLGIIAFAALGSTDLVAPLLKYPIDYVGGVVNALIISYAILRYQLLDIRFVMRKGLVYSSLTVFLTALYLLLLFILQTFWHGWIGYSSLALAAVFALLIAVLFNPLRNFLQKGIDRTFFRETYDYRQMLLSFSHKISNVLDLGELAQSILDPIVKVLHIQRAALLFPRIESGDFATQFVQQATTEEPSTKLRLTNDNPIVTWLTTEGKVLKRELIDINPQFKGLWEAERAALEALGVELLYPIRSRGNLIGILAVGKKQPDSSYSQEEIDLLMTMANEAAVAIENARLYQESQKSRERFEVISELTRIINSSLDIGKVYKAFSESIKKLVDFDQASINLVDELKQNLRILALSQDTPSVVEAGNIMPLNGSGTQWVIENKKVNIETDLAKKRQFSTDVGLLAQGFKSTIRLPLRSRGEVIGTFNLRSRHPHTYSEREQKILEQLVAQIADAIDNAKAHNSLKNQQLRVRQLLTQAVRAQEEERKRISADLHDSVAQWLVAASYRAQTCNELLSGHNNNEAQGELAAIESTIDKSLKELRRVVTGLRPPALDELGLSHALRQSLEDLKTDGVDCQFSKVGTPVRLSSSTEIAVYRMVQEALSNVRKHANATKVNLRLQFQADKLLVEVRDNGRGFNLSQTLDSAISVGHMGILGMRQRVEALGGDIKIKTGEGAGTTITLRLPIQPQIKER